MAEVKQNIKDYIKAHTPTSRVFNRIHTVLQESKQTKDAVFDTFLTEKEGEITKLFNTWRQDYREGFKKEQKQINTQYRTFLEESEKQIQEELEVEL